MRAHALLPAFALLSLLALPGCQEPDVGGSCPLTWTQNPGMPPPPTPATVQGAYFESGNTFCDALICIVSPAPPSSKYGSCDGSRCGYCSKPCASDRDCYSDQTGLKCQQLILDPAFIASLDEATRQRYLNEIVSSWYCVAPQ